MTDKRPETEEEFEEVLTENDELVNRFGSGDIHALASLMEATGAKVTSTKVTEPARSN